MSNHTHTNTSSTRPGVGTRIKGVFETVHGVGENIRGRTLGAIDDVKNPGASQKAPHYASMVERGRMQVETGMAHIYGDPDPHAGNAFHDEPGRIPQSTTGTFGSDHTGTGPGTGSTSTGEHDYYGRGGGIGRGAGRGHGGFGTDDGYRQHGSQNLEQQPAIDRDTEMGPSTGGKGKLSPNRGPPNTGSEKGWSSMSQVQAHTPAQQRMGQDPPPELPPRPQARAADNDQSEQMYQ